jgi:hypothetical protein
MLTGLGGFAGLQLAEALARFFFLAFPLHARFFIILALLHFLEKAFFDEFLLEDPKGLIDLVIAYDDFHALAFLRPRLSKKNGTA